MNTYQKAYIVAKKLYEHALNQVQEWMRPYGYLLERGDDASIMRFCEFEAGFEKLAKVPERREALLDAENALLDWAQKTMKRLYPQHTEDIDIAIEQGRRWMHHREKLLDTAVRLAA